MPGATSNLHVERLIHSPSRDDDACLECIVEDNAISNMPGCRIEGVCSFQSYLFLHGEDDHDRWMGQPALDDALQHLQNNRDAGSVICPQIGRSVAVKYAVSQHWLVTETGRNAIHMRVEQHCLTLAGKRTYQIASFISLRRNPKLV